MRFFIRQVIFLIANVGTFTSHCTSLASPYPIVKKCENSLLGIEMHQPTGDTEDSPNIKYILPVTNMGQHDVEDEETTQVGMIPMDKFQLEMIPLKTFLEEFYIPPSVKLLLVDPNK